MSPAEMVMEPHLNGSESTCTQNSIDIIFGVRSWCLDNTLRSGVFFFRREDHCTYCLRRKACGRANFDKREQGIFTGALYSSSKLRGLGLGLTFIQSALIHRSTGYTRHLPLVYGSLARARRLELSTGVALIEGLEAEFRLSKESWRLANSFRPRQP